MTQPADAHCPRCGKPVSADDLACAGCGAALSETPSADPADPGPSVGAPSGEQRAVTVSAAHAGAGSPLHSHVLAAALTLCFGLVVVRWGFAWFGLLPPASARRDSVDHLLALQGLASSATLIYVLLRRDEGDFKALLIATLLLFCGEELLHYFSDSFGVLAFGELARLTALTAAIFASLALTAAAYDAPAVWRTPVGRAAVVANVAILGLACLRGVGVLFAGGGEAGPGRVKYDRWTGWAGLAILTVSLVYMLLMLLRGETRGREPSAARPGAAGTPTAPHAEAPAAASDAGSAPPLEG